MRRPARGVETRRMSETGAQATRTPAGPGGSGWKQYVRPAALLLVAAVSLYLLLPSLLSVFSSWRIAVATRLALRDPRARSSRPRASSASGSSTGSRCARASWFAVACAQLSGNAVGRIVPGGGATATAFSVGMLRRAGIDTGEAAAAFTASTGLQLATTAGPAAAGPAGDHRRRDGRPRPRGGRLCRHRRAPPAGRGRHGRAHDRSAAHIRGTCDPMAAQRDRSAPPARDRPAAGAARRPRLHPRDARRALASGRCSRLRRTRGSTTSRCSARCGRSARRPGPRSSCSPTPPPSCSPSSRSRPAASASSRRAWSARSRSPVSPGRTRSPPRFSTGSSPTGCRSRPAASPISSSAAATREALAQAPACSTAGCGAPTN